MNLVFGTIFALALVLAACDGAAAEFSQQLVAAGRRALAKLELDMADTACEAGLVDAMAHACAGEVLGERRRQVALWAAECLVTGSGLPSLGCRVGEPARNCTRALGADSGGFQVFTQMLVHVDHVCAFVAHRAQLQAMDARVAALFAASESAARAVELVGEAAAAQLRLARAARADQQALQVVMHAVLDQVRRAGSAVSTEFSPLPVLLTLFVLILLTSTRAPPPIVEAGVSLLLFATSTSSLTALYLVFQAFHHYKRP